MSLEKTVIVVGGAGYIGSQCVLDLKDSSYTPVVVDNFSRGHRFIAERLGVELCEGSLEDQTFMTNVLKTYRPVAVMHFAAYAYVGESVSDPALYYHNNVATTLSLLDAMKAQNVMNFIFSSTCATYGIPQTVPLTEETPQNPISPYGFTKLVVERILRDYESAYGMRSMIFRYFNAAGGHPSAQIGELHDPETHLIPLAINAALGKGELTVLGNDYDTPDGTCIRDYIHVADISKAHILGLEYLLKEKKSNILNIGTGTGTSVLEIIKAVEKVSGKKVPYKFGERRAGDPPRLVASSGKIQRELSWTPKYTDIEEIVRTAWNWHEKQ